MKPHPTEHAATAIALMLGLALFAPSSASAVGLGKRCGGFVGIQCDEGLFCELAAARCNVADSLGTCVKASSVCTRIYRPVCGCDDKTYGNDCARRAAKVSKKHDGRCPAT